MKNYLVVCVTAFTLVTFQAKAETAIVTELPDGSVSQSEGLENWGKVFEVFSHPRCSNCHVGAEAQPMWSGPHYGETRVHGMNIFGGETRIGSEYVPCSTCHQQTNSDLLHGPPGAEIWLLPPPEMEWWQKSSSHICEQIKDPERNGDRTILEVAEHIAHDDLVLWGWRPGKGREPAPYSAQQTVDFIMKWKAAGAPCPG